MAFGSQITRIDDRDRLDRVQVQTGYWDIQISHLVNAYLSFQAKSNNEGMAAIPAARDNDSASVFTIKVLDIFCKTNVDLTLRY